MSPYSQVDDIRPIGYFHHNVAKKYALFYHLWVSSGIFPLRAYPANFDFNNLTCYESSEAKAAAYATELRYTSSYYYPAKASDEVWAIQVACKWRLQTSISHYLTLIFMIDSHSSLQLLIQSVPTFSSLSNIKDSTVQLFAHLIPALDSMALGDWKANRQPCLLVASKAKPAKPQWPVYAAHTHPFQRPGQHGHPRSLQK